MNQFTSLVNLQRNLVHEFFLSIYIPVVKLWLLKLWVKAVDVVAIAIAIETSKGKLQFKIMHGTLAILCLIFNSYGPWLTERTWFSWDSP